MKSKLFLLQSPHHRWASAGFTLIELMVSLLIAGIMLALTASFTQTTVAARHNTSLTMEADQGLRSLLQVVTQELRQAGACLPQNGTFVTLAGVNNGTTDSLTLRIGQTNKTTLVCVRTGTATPTAAGGTTLTVPNGDGLRFVETDMVYVLPPGSEGAFYTVESTSTTTITLNETLPTLHPAGTGIYAVDERTYAVDTSTYGRPMLTVAMNGGEPQPLIDGVELFNVMYRLGPCEPTCASEVDLPADDNAWQLVQEVLIKASVRAHKPDKQGTFAVATTGKTGQVGEYLSIKPRNLL